MIMRVTVAFERWGDSPNWINKIVGFFVRYHVLLTLKYPDNDKVCIVVDPQITGMRVYPAYIDEVDAELRTMRFHSWYEIGVEQEPVQFSWLEPMTCVTIAKRVLGINKFWVLTPRQLMRELKRYG
jgi:hypothetical protein